MLHPKTYMHKFAIRRITLLLPATSTRIPRRTVTLLSWGTVPITYFLISCFMFLRSLDFHLFSFTAAPNSHLTRDVVLDITSEAHRTTLSHASYRYRPPVQLLKSLLGRSG